jgi:hypothetical protein
MMAVWCCDYIIPEVLRAPYGNVIALGHYINEDGSPGRTRALNRGEELKIEVTEFKPLRKGKGWATVPKTSSGYISISQTKLFPCSNEWYDTFEIEWKEIR